MAKIHIQGGASDEFFESAAYSLVPKHMKKRKGGIGKREKIEGLFDAVITNPPIRAGKAVIYAMFEQALAHLKPGGKLYLVVRKQQGAPSTLKYLRTLYAQAEVIARDGGYWVIECGR